MEFVPSNRPGLPGLVLATLLSGAFSTALRAEDTAKVLAEWAIDEDRAIPRFDCRVDGFPLALYLDTGMAKCLTIRHKDTLFLYQRRPVFTNAIGLAETKRVAFFPAQSIVIGQLNCGRSEFQDNADKYEQIRMTHDGGHGYGGSGLFREAVLQIDYDARVCRVLSRYTPKPEEARLEFYSLDGVPVIRWKMGEFCDAVIDTGNDAAFSLSRDLADRLVGDREAIIYHLNLPDGRQNDVPRCIVRELKFAGMVIPNAHGVVGQVNTIGLQTLSRFRVTIDYPKRVLYLAPRQREFPTDTPDASGLVLMRDPQGCYVYWVESGSSAFEVGLRAEDRILAIDDVDVSSWSLPRLEQTFSRGGETVRLKVRRGTEEFEQPLKLRYPLEYPPKWPAKRERLIRTIPE